MSSLWNAEPPKDMKISIWHKGCFYKSKHGKIWYWNNYDWVRSFNVEVTHNSIAKIQAAKKRKEEQHGLNTT